MLAAQCNKLSSKSPPPLADAAVGKGFHPWKKSPTGPNSPPNPTSTPPAQRSNSTTINTSANSYTRPVMTACSSANTTSSGYGDNLYFPGASAQPAELHNHQGSLLGKVESGGLGSVYSRHPYDSWPFNTMGHNHGAIKGETVNTGRSI